MAVWTPEGQAMAHDPQQVQAVFLQAVELPPAERLTFLDRACADDGDLRRRVETLLRAHDDPGAFLHQPAVPPGPDPRPAGAVRPPADAAVGAQVGPYRLLQKLGEGGMGAVYVAQQDHPVKRRVALKVIRPGLDSRQVVARFGAERQALALMDHPHIARVLDAGSTADGRPYFVMELVPGVTLTKYCDELNLPVRERLGLFVPVCRAIQHAHQKGVIHRDVKPSNVLVCMQDGRPVPKVIDFGVAKATGQRLTEASMDTEIGQVIGTLEYMSPEQAEVSPLGVDTRADVYALGVLLYELLTGTTPLGRERLRGAGFAEVLRLIREEEPAKPSTRLTGSREALAGAAARRGTEPGRLVREVRGELDWIVMKALEKDRTRRYETATGLARDVERHLTEEPVEAGPPSAGYRLRKALRKYRRPLATAAAFLALLAAGGAALGWQAVRLARADRDQAVQRAQRERDAQDALGRAAALREQARAANDPGKWADARALARRAEGLLVAGPADEGLTEQVHTLLRELDAEENDRRIAATLEDLLLRQADNRVRGAGRFEAAPLYEAAFRQYGIDLEVMSVGQAAERVRRSAIRDLLLAGLDDWQATGPRPGPGGVTPRAVAQAADDDTMRRRLREVISRNDQAALKALATDAAFLNQPPSLLIRCGHALRAVGMHEQAVTFLRRAQRRYPGDFGVNYLLALYLRAIRPPRAGEAVGYHRAALALRPGHAELHYHLGHALHEQGDPAGAVACFRRAIELDPAHASAHVGVGNYLAQHLNDRAGAVACFRRAIELDPKNPEAYQNLGNVLMEQGDRAGAIASYRKALELDPNHAPAHFNVGYVLQAQRDLPGAIASYRRAVELDPKYAEAHTNLGLALLDRGDPAGAVACFRRAVELDPKLVQAHYNLGRALLRQGDPAGAAARYRKALELDPKLVRAHNNLGALLNDHLKDHAGAAGCFRRAIELDPKNVSAHVNLGVALKAQGDLPGAVASYRRAIELDPRSAHAHYYLGLALDAYGDLDGAIASFRKTIELNPRITGAHHDLGLALQERGDLPGAAACFRGATELDPKDAVSYCGLGRVLREQGEFAAALTALRTGHELGSKQKGWRCPSALWIRQCERLVELDGRLPAVVRGEARPADAAERLEFADLCRIKKLYAAAARLVAEALAADATLANDLKGQGRHNAACCAALAGYGRGTDAGPLGAAERARLRRQARDWLRADLTVLAGQLGSGSPAARAAAQRSLRHLQTNSDLAGVRDAAGLAELPAEEQAEWKKFWADVAGLLANGAAAK